MTDATDPQPLYHLRERDGALVEHDGKVWVGTQEAARWVAEQFAFFDSPVELVPAQGVRLWEQTEVA